ncbi:MAG: AAA family ATPase [Rhodobacteraceae bacterium]|nr:AAA family ATPase [Paracoccaceae bacterium]MCZ8083042.1 AAA family ATPase [Paracoccaceae bacterium]
MEEAVSWRKLARAAFEDFLGRKYDALREQEKHREKVRQRIVLNFDEAATLVDSHDVSAFTIQLPDVFSLPWMPKESVLPSMLAVAKLAQAIPDGNTLARILSPGTLTEFRMRGVPADNEDIRSEIEAALICWANLLGVPPSTHDVSIKTIPEGTNGAPKKKSYGEETFASRVEKALCAGDSVVVIASDLATEHQEVSDLIDLTLIAPPMSRDCLIELITILHPDAAALPRSELRESLPDDISLRRLSPTRIEIALRQPTAEALFSRLREKPVSRKPRTTLSDVHGQKEAVSQLSLMIDDLERWKNGELKWSEASMSAVMHGPPGNGKTMIAEAFAGSANIPLVSTSYSECQSSGHQGDMLKALMNAFQKAKDEKPAVLFIDEIDSFSDRSAQSHNSEYMRGVVNGLLTEISRAIATPGLVLLAATNDLSVVDPAVIRPGRFDIKLPIRNPDKEGIARILLANLPEAEFDEAERDDLFSIARQLVGSSGAQAATIARQALRYARIADRAVTVADVRKACGSMLTEDKDTLFRKAIHEAGHAVARYYSVLSNPVRIQLSQGASFVEAPNPTFFTELTANAELCVLLAGRAAEIVCLGKVSSGSGEGPGSDLAVATHLALKIEAEWHLDAAKPWASTQMMMSVGIPNELKARVAVRLQQAEEEALKVISEQQDAVTALAQQLMESRTMNGDQISTMIETARKTCGATTH